MECSEGRDSCLSGRHVLVVDDCSTNCTLMEMIIKRYGAEVHFAYSGEESLEKVKEQDFDVVFMDIQMPCMNGIEATKQIRELKGGRDLRIVAVTAAYSSKERDAILEHGFDEFIPKPIKLARIRAFIEGTFALDVPPVCHN